MLSPEWLFLISITKIRKDWIGKKTIVNFLLGKKKYIEKDETELFQNKMYSWLTFYQCFKIVIWENQGAEYYL